MLDGIDILLKKRKKVDAGEFRKFFGYLDDTLSYYESHSPEFLNLVLSFYNYKHGIAQAVDKELYTRIDWAEDTAQFYIMAAERYSNGSLVMQQDYYGKAAGVYERVGMAAKAEKLRQRIAEIGNSPARFEEFKKVGHHIGLSEEEVNKILEALGVGHEVPYNMFVHFLPRWDTAVKEASDNSHPLLNMISKVIDGKEGYPVAVRQGGDEEAHARYAFRNMISIACRYLKIFLRKKIDAGEVTFEHFDALFQKIKIIDEPTYLTVREGLNYFFRGEFLAAVHILAPHLEDFLRRLLPLADLSPIQPNPYQPDCFEKKTLRAVLKGLEGVLPSDVYHNLNCILNDLIGSNLRNEVAHGGVKNNEDNELHCVMLIQLYCAVLIILRPKESENQQS